MVLLELVLPLVQPIQFIYISVHNIKNLKDGIYKYQSVEHKLNEKVKGNKSKELYQAALNQSAIRSSAGVIIITAEYDKTTRKYGQRGKKYNI